MKSSRLRGSGPDVDCAAHQPGVASPFSTATTARAADAMASEHTIDRRTFLSTLTSACVAAATADLVAAPAAQSLTAAPPANASTGARIDMHHHFAPPAWIEEVRGRPLLQPANTRWTAAQSLEDMDRGS